MSTATTAVAGGEVIALGRTEIARFTIATAIAGHEISSLVVRSTDDTWALVMRDIVTHELDVATFPNREVALLSIRSPEWLWHDVVAFINIARPAGVNDVALAGDRCGNLVRLHREQLSRYVVGFGRSTAARRKILDRISDTPIDDAKEPAADDRVMLVQSSAYVGGLLISCHPSAADAIESADDEDEDEWRVSSIIDLDDGTVTSASDARIQLGGDHRRHIQNAVRSALADIDADEVRAIVESAIRTAAR